jgi:predicted metal-binding membrane protein
MNYHAELKRRWSEVRGQTVDSINYSFYFSAAGIFLASAATTVYFCNSMRDGVAVLCGPLASRAAPTISMSNWAASAPLFMAMWSVMMVAMMLPSLMPALIDYRRRSGLLRVTRVNQLTCWVFMGYFTVWIAAGVPVYLIATLLADLSMRMESVRRHIPVANGLAVAVAGCIQLSNYKLHRLRRCQHRAPSIGTVRSAAWHATQHGIGLGMTCFLCCFNLMAVLLASGVMNLKAMAALTAAISVERIRSIPVCTVWLMGAALIAIGMSMIANATLSEPIAAYYP